MFTCWYLTRSSAKVGSCSDNSGCSRLNSRQLESKECKRITAGAPGGELASQLASSAALGPAKAVEIGPSLMLGTETDTRLRRETSDCASSSFMSATSCGTKAGTAVLGGATACSLVMERADVRWSRQPGALGPPCDREFCVVWDLTRSNIRNGAVPTSTPP
jgi:hypothetical protein